MLSLAASVLPVRLPAATNGAATFGMDGSFDGLNATGKVTGARVGMTARSLAHSSRSVAISSTAAMRATTSATTLNGVHVMLSTPIPAKRTR